MLIFEKSQVTKHYVQFAFLFRTHCTFHSSTGQKFSTKNLIIL